ncbi:DUF938 domain-containing protein [Altererythrobacter sp. H2]|uniref:DUF938 domain-containing protein n=1 Tax=Altererythrobacter sp. H2 TaxID=3108391 RepID=UPI002B4C23FC|nr:DUF938 domain-containing protein [Altererythrobacter sp. H2]WRK97301.1 DUF938 domain-containing protein [Altererythrobacter sp. H2]
MKRHAPATARNSAAIAVVLAKELPLAGRVLEVASGTGEHAVYFARAFPQLKWQPSDADITALASIAEWAAEARLENLREPLHLDASAPGWPVDRADAVLCINMVHISPWQATEGLFAGAAASLGINAPIILYGPYREEGLPTAASNEAFDADLRSRDPRWGLRQVKDMDRVAGQHGFFRAARYQMPANNLTLVYRRR